MASSKSFSLVLPMLAACAASAGRDPSEAAKIPWSQINSRGGQQVHLCGWFQAGIEECSLAPSRDVIDPANQIWVLARSKICLPENAIREPKQAWADVTGTLNVGGGFGHLGLYGALLDDSEVKLRKAPCGE